MTKNEKAILKQAIKQALYQAFRLAVVLVSMALMCFVIFHVMAYGDIKW